MEGELHPMMKTEIHATHLCVYTKAPILDEEKNGYVTRDQLLYMPYSEELDSCQEFRVLFSFAWYVRDGCR